MNRRDFLSVVTKTVAGAGVVQFLISCGKNGGVSTDLTVTSSTVNGHNHTFTLTAAEIAAGAAIARGDTGSGHSHLVSVTQSDLQNIAAGNTVNVNSATTNGHNHTYVLKKG